MRKKQLNIISAVISADIIWKLPSGFDTQNKLGRNNTDRNWRGQPITANNNTGC